MTLSRNRFRKEIDIELSVCNTKIKHYCRANIILSVVDITVLVALSVYQLIVKNTLPVTSKSVPVVGQSSFTKIVLNLLLLLAYYYCYYYTVFLGGLLRATAYMLSAHMLSQFRPSVCPSVCPSVRLSVRPAHG